MSEVTIKFEIVTPERVVLKERVKRVTAPTKQGEITILPGHILLVAILMSGVIETESETGEINIMSVSGGFIEVFKNKIVILADTAERAEEIQLEKAEEARRRAERARKELWHHDAERFASISARISRELARERAVKKYRKLKNINK